MPGSRAKIAVTSRDSSIDPVGACVGMRGSRVQAVVGELQGEKIDIIPWSYDRATFIVNALQPAEVVKVVLDEDAERIEVVVPDDQLSLAIGRRGQNVRLASQLTGWDIDILTEAEESERRQKEFTERTELFMAALDVDETVGQLLAAEGFRNVEEVATVEPTELASIQGFDDETGAEIQRRAQDYLDRIEAEQESRRRELGVQDELKEVDGVTVPMLVAFGENDVKTIEDLAGCATDDLVGYTEGRGADAVRTPGYLDGFELSRAEAEHMILAARVKAGWIEAQAEAGGRRGIRRDGLAAELTAPHEAISQPARSRLPRHDSERSCIVTREAGAASDLMRFVRDPEGRVVPDLKGKLPGRGAWVTPTAALLGEAVKRRLFTRAFKQEAVASPTLVQDVESALERDLLGALALANKAGAVTMGFFKVEAALAARRAAALIHAREAAQDGRRKLAAALRKADPDTISALPTFDDLR